MKTIEGKAAEELHRLLTEYWGLTDWNEPETPERDKLRGRLESLRTVFQSAFLSVIKEATAEQSAQIEELVLSLHHLCASIPDSKLMARLGAMNTLKKHGRVLQSAILNRTKGE